MDYNADAKLMRQKQLDLFKRCGLAMCYKHMIYGEDAEELVQDAALYFCKRTYNDLIPFTSQVHYCIARALRDSNSRQAKFERAAKHFNLENWGHNEEQNL